MGQREDGNYEIVKNNYLTHETSPSPIEVVEGESLAISRVDYYRAGLTPEERKAGWSFYTQRTTSPITGCG
jgi:hypothetical protein